MSKFEARQQNQTRKSPGRQHQGGQQHEGGKLRNERKVRIKLSSENSSVNFANSKLCKTNKSTFFFYAAFAGNKNSTTTLAGLSPAPFSWMHRFSNNIPFCNWEASTSTSSALSYFMCLMNWQTVL